jgi:hypothetical protein
MSQGRADKVRTPEEMAMLSRKFDSLKRQIVAAPYRTKEERDALENLCDVLADNLRITRGIIEAPEIATAAEAMPGTDTTPEPWRVMAARGASRLDHDTSNPPLAPWLAGHVGHMMAVHGLAFEATLPDMNAGHFSWTRPLTEEEVATLYWAWRLVTGRAPPPFDLEEDARAYHEEVERAGGKP